jgi:phosphate transport system substrate-binding protein
VAIQELNPGVVLPSEAITAYYRSDPSGENYLLSDYFLHVDPGPLTTFQQVAGVPTPPGTPSATWESFNDGIPPSLNSLDGVNGADAASQGPTKVPGGISYVETAYAKNVGLPVASVVNVSGNAVLPTAQNTTEALEAAIQYSDLTENLAGVYDDTAADAYPLSGVSYFVAQCVPAQAAAQNFACDSGGKTTMGTARGAELAQFITYAACLGQSQMANLGYAPLPPNLVEEVFQAAGRLPGGTTPPPPTASNCQNPTLTGTPTITSLDPTSGRVGTVVAIKGTDLDGATKVSFDGVVASIRKDTPTKIKVAVPAGAGTGKIKVTTPGGQAKTPAAFTVT